MKKLLLGCIFFLSVCGFGQVLSYVPVAGLLGYWPFNANANDESGNSNHGTVSGALLTTDRFSVANSAYSFDIFSYARIEINNVSALSGMNALTISVWVNMPYFNNDFQSLVTKWQRVNDCSSGYPAKDYLTTIEGSYLNLATTNNTLGFSSPYTLSSSDLNRWEHFVFTQDGQGQAVYVNGVLSATNSSTGQLCQSNINVLFGASRQGAAYERFFNGKMDDIGIWNRRLDDCEIKKLYSAPASLTASATDTLICAGEAVVLSATGAQSYSWSTSSTSQTLVVTPSQSTTYSVLGNYESGCADTATIEVQIANCTGIKKEKGDAVFMISPKYNSGFLKCSTHDRSGAAYVVTLEDLSGNRVFEQTMEAESQEFNIQHLENGIYLAKIKSKHKEVFLIEKIVLQK